VAVHRKRKPRQPRTISRVASLGALNIPGSNTGGDGDLRKAADTIAADARRIAGSWSVKIPPSIYVTVEGNVATVHAAAPNARPAEFRLYHPLFGNREKWYGPPGEPFLGPALDARIDDALRVYARSAGTYAKRHGWK
jgi:hypothetical protein